MVQDAISNYPRAVGFQYLLRRTNIIMSLAVFDYIL